MSKVFERMLLALMAAATIANAQTKPAETKSIDRPFPFMAEMEQPYRELRAQIKDRSANESSLGIVRLMQRNSIAAKETVPPLIAKLPAAEQGAWLLAYRQLMLKAIHLELELEEHLLAADNVKAAATLESLNKVRVEGHDRFRGRYDPKTKQLRLPPR